MNQILDNNRITEFIKKTIENYEYNQRINNFIEKIQEENTDGTFVRIGLRPLVKREMFLPQKGDVYIASEIFGLGHSIAVGEINYFIKEILNNKEIRKIKIKKKEFNPDSLSEILNELKGVITIFQDSGNNVDLLNNPIWKNNLGYKGRTLQFNSYPVINIGGDLLKNKIILFDKLSSIWINVMFRNRKANIISPLNIQIGSLRNDSEVDVLVNSLVKLKIHEPNQIKIIELV